MIKYSSFLSKLFGEVFPEPFDFENDDSGFIQSAATAFVKGIQKMRFSGIMKIQDDLCDVRQVISTAVRKDEDELKKEIDRLEQEIVSLKNNLEDRKILERAKGILMKTGLDEKTAYLRLQKMATSQNLKLTVLAKKLLDLEQLFHSEE
jgi:ANTAR domain